MISILYIEALRCRSGADRVNDIYPLAYLIKFYTQFALPFLLMLLNPNVYYNGPSTRSCIPTSKLAQATYVQNVEKVYAPKHVHLTFQANFIALFLTGHLKQISLQTFAVIEIDKKYRICINM